MGPRYSKKNTVEYPICSNSWQAGMCLGMSVLVVKADTVLADCSASKDAAVLLLQGFTAAQATQLPAAHTPVCLPGNTRQQGVST
jgi:hypothetical protein